MNVSFSAGITGGCLSVRWRLRSACLRFNRFNAPGHALKFSFPPARPLVYIAGMKNSSVLKYSGFILLSLAVMAFTGCSDLNDPYRPPPRYDDPYYRSDRDYYRDREIERQRRERRELERERDRLEDERKRLEEERRRDKYRPPPPAPKPSQDRCPPGFSPSERKCTTEERKRGCKDIRTPGGLGCVSR